MKLLCFLALTIAIASCSSDTKNIPNATGNSGDIFVVMDSLQWRGPLGNTIDSIFSAEMPGLPRKESIFKFRWIDPRKLNFILKQSRNLIFVMTLDQQTEGARIIQRLFTPASLEKIKASPKEFLATTPNVFAKGQDIMYLYGSNENILIKNIRSNGQRLIDYFNKREYEKLSRSIFKSGQLKGISDMLTKDFNCDMRIPFGFKLADKKEDFVWLRQINPKDDKNIFITRKPYVSQEDFKKENLVRFRDDVCRKYLFEDPDQSDTYLMTETKIPFVPVTADTVNFNGSFGIELRGLWRSNTLAMGGPFIGFALVDENTQQFYYVEGFTFSPGKDQREIMRELDTILRTFRVSKKTVNK